MLSGSEIHARFGDRAKIETEIRDLGWGDIQLLDADGNRLTRAEQPHR